MFTTSKGRIPSLMRKNKSCLSSHSVFYLKLPERGSFKDLRVDSCLTIIARGDTCTDKAKDFIGKGCQGRQQQGVRENCSTHGLQSQVLWRWDQFPVSLWLIIFLIPILVPLRNLLVVHASLRQDGSQHKGLAEAGRTYHGLVSAPSFWALPNSIDWFWAGVCSLFLGPPEFY